jgi:dihydrodipicolinate synthase/N-acetylneuraminate lyase
VLTPFNADESPDEGAFRALIAFLIARGVHGLFPLGSAGEGPLLTREERIRLGRVAVDAAAGRVPVMLHTGAATTAESVELTRAARDAGADAGSILPPYYFRYDDEAIFAHLRSVADAVPGFPIYVYNNPATTGNPISATTLVRLCEACPNIVGMKDSSDSLAQTQEYLSRCGDRLAVLSGSSVLAVTSLVVGCSGLIYSFANAFPEVAVAMWSAFCAGDLAGALARQNTVLALRGVMLKNGGVTAGLKALVAARGLPFGGARRPARELRPDERAAVEGAARRLGLLTA